MSATVTETKDEGKSPETVAPPVDIESIVAQKVADALAAVLPNIVSQLAGNGPSQSVEVAPTSVAKQTPFGHYRKDGTTVGKYQEFDMDCIEAGTDRAFCAKKGSWITFTSGHCYPESSNQQRQLDWKIANDPFCGIYADEGGSVLPCPVNGCREFFSNERGLKAHMAATHGVR